MLHKTEGGALTGISAVLETFRPTSTAETEPDVMNQNRPENKRESRFSSRFFNVMYHVATNIITGDETVCAPPPLSLHLSHVTLNKGDKGHKKK